MSFGSLQDYGKKTTKSTQKNRGGVIGGAEYLGTQFGAGIIGVGEGLYDFVVGGVADLIGQDEYTKRLMEDQVAGKIQQKAAEKYNPSKGMQFAGEVAGGLGQTALYAGIGIATGGAGLASFGTIALGAGGQAVQQAYQKTGKLGAKEWTYGALSGTAEGMLENMWGVSGKIASRLGGTAVAKTAVREGFIKTTLKEGGQEFVEEFLGDVADTVAQKITIDPSASFNVNDAVHSGVVGFVSGAIGSGISQGAMNAKSESIGKQLAQNGFAEIKASTGLINKAGTRIVNTGSTENVLNNARTLLSSVSDETNSEFLAGNLQQLKGSLDAYDKLADKSGIRGRMLLGEIAQNVAYTQASYGVQESLSNIQENATAIAQALTQQGQNVTAEDIINDKDGIATSLAIQDFSGKLMLDDATYEAMLRQGETVKNMNSQFEAWRSNLTQEQKNAIDTEIGANIDTMTAQEVSNAFESNRERIRQEVLSRYGVDKFVTEEAKAKYKAQRNALKDIQEWQDKLDTINSYEAGKQSRKAIQPLPSEVSLNKGESEIYRAENGNVVAVKRTNEGYFVAVDGADGQALGKTAKAVSESEINDVISSLSNMSNEQLVRMTKKEIARTETEAETEVKTEEAVKTETEAIETKKPIKQFKEKIEQKTLTETARKYVPNFDNLGANTKARIRDMLRTAQGVDASSVEAVANIMAVRDGLQVMFEGKGINVQEKGSYDSKTRLALINADKGSSVVKQTIIHEISHDFNKTEFGNILDDYAMNNTSKELIDSIKQTYSNYFGEEISQDELRDEVCARFFEENINIDNFFKRFSRNAIVLQQDSGFLATGKKIAQKFKDLIKGKNDASFKLSKAYENMFDEALVLADKRYAEQHFDEGFMEASQNFTRLNLSSFNEVNPTTQKSGKELLNEYLNKAYGEKTATEMVGTLTDIANYVEDLSRSGEYPLLSKWEDTKLVVNDKGNISIEATVNNGEYKMNIDFSKVCKKRRQLNKVLNYLASLPEFDAKDLTGESIVKINQKIKEAGFEVACDLCFVDSKRFRQGQWALSFSETWNEIMSAITEDTTKLTSFNFALNDKNLGDDKIKINTDRPITIHKYSDGKITGSETYKNLNDVVENGMNENVKTIARLIRDEGRMRHWFRSADIIASNGFDEIAKFSETMNSVLSGWGGSSVPKPSTGDVVYDSTVLTDGRYKAIDAFEMGGARMNSFSDYMSHMFLDYMQAVTDMSAKGLPVQSYTKVLDFARMFGITNAKINMSGIPANAQNDIYSIKLQNKKTAKNAGAEVDAGLDVTKIAEKLGKAKQDLTTEDIVNNLDLAEYVWSQESVNMVDATLLEYGILYDKLSDLKKERCYNLLEQGNISLAHKVAGAENVDIRYAKNLGTIVVGVSDAHIRKLLRDPRIRMVIPYHKSGLNPEIAKALKIKAYNDYSSFQNTSIRKIGTEKGVGFKSKTSPYKIIDFNFYDYFGKTIDGKLYDGKETAKKYLEWCEKGAYNPDTKEYGYFYKYTENKTTTERFITSEQLHSEGYEIIPKFEKFSDEENYYKVLEDFDCYNTITGEHSPQLAVSQELPNDWREILTRSLKEEQAVEDEFSKYADSESFRNEILQIVKKNKTTERKSLSLEAVEPITPTSDSWSRTIDTEEAMRRFPNLWNIAADESETRNPTQIKGTVTTYNKIYDILKAEGFDGTILDASSGLGYGTQSGIENYGFNVEDIEPYPDKNYKPKYKDYSKLNKKYDVIISNAVLNVIPQDQRDALVVKMGNLLKDGGKLYVNVRGDDVNTLSSNPNNVKIGDMEWYVSSTGSYQKGFTRDELVAYLKDALGDGFIVTPTTKFGKTSAIVEKQTSAKKYSIETAQVIMDTHPQSKMTLKEFKEQTKSYRTKLRNELVDSFFGIEEELKRLGSTDAEAKIQQVRNARSSAQNAIAGDVRNIADGSGKLMSKGLKKIFQPVYNQGESVTRECFEYLLEKHNIDRLKQNKPVTGHTAEESREIIKKYESQHPEFKTISEELNGYTRALLQMRVDAGLITKETMDNLVKMYPNYVPTYRDVTKQGTRGLNSSRYDIMVSKTLKKAEGSTEDIIRIDEVLARQTMQVYSAITVNNLANELYNKAIAKDDFQNVALIPNETNDNLQDTEFLADLENTKSYKPNEDNNSVTFWIDGERATIRVADDLFHGFKDIGSSTYELNTLKGMRKVMNVFRNLVTSWSPLFMVRNVFRDFGDALVYTKYGTGNFIKHYAQAFKEMKQNSEHWQEYNAFGGRGVDVYDVSQGFKIDQEFTDNNFRKGAGNIFKKSWTKLQNVAEFTEQLPRFAEFIAARESGKTIEQSAYEAADVTVNFSRSGKVTRTLNGTVMPFLNASVQGFDKTIRTFMQKGGSKYIGSLLIKCAILGIVPQLFNNYVYDDDEEYKDLRDSDKEQNYLIKIGGKFIKIPKGRLQATIGTITNKAQETVRGEGAEWGEVPKTIISNLTPVENISRTILSPFTDVASNTTWYGTKIEGQQFDGVRVEDRFDETTSSLAIALAKLPTSKALELSPKKIHYLLDQYTGSAGDIVLAMTTKQAEGGYFEKGLTVDPILSNKLSTKFYKIYDEATYRKNSGDENAQIELRYLNKAKSAINDLYKQKSMIQNSTLSDKEKRSQVRIIQSTINESLKGAVGSIKQIEQSIKATEPISIGVEQITKTNYKKYGVGEDKIGQFALTYSGRPFKYYEKESSATDGAKDLTTELRYTEAMRISFGAKYALESYNSQVYSKSKLLNTAGISYEDFYNAYFSDKTSKDKSYTFANISSYNLTKVKKLMLMLSLGYTIKDGDIKGMTAKNVKAEVGKYINSLKISKDEKVQLANICGLTVKDGKIVIK